MIRAVLDANVHARTLIQPLGPSGQIHRRLAAEPSFRLVTSTSILDEVLRCLFYPRVRKRIDLSDQAIRQWVAAIGVVADVVTEPASLNRVSADPDDDKYIAVALEGRAQYVVTGDRHLLDLEHHEGVQMVPPASFLRLLRP